MKFICSLLVAVIVGSFSCSAADLDSVDYYSLSPVHSLSPTVNSALDYAVQPLAATSWDTSDQAHLAAIRNALTYATTIGDGSVFGWVQLIGQSFKNGIFDDILDSLETIDSNFTLNISANEGSLVDSLRDIRDALVISPTVSSGSLVDNVRKIYLSASSSALSLEEINDAIQNDYNSLKSLLTAIWGDTDSILTHVASIDTGVSAIVPLVSSIASDVSIIEEKFSATLLQDVTLSDGSVRTVGANYRYASFAGAVNSAFDGVLSWTGDRTLYSRIKQLQEVLASDDDLALANSQKANREEIEDSFLNGSSGSTSLGASDFGDLADVGGTIKDSLSLGGNATIGSFTSGLSAADSAGQGWFSEETRSQLDAVSSTVTYSLRDPDPYNMEGWEDRYYWLLGDDE